MPLHTDETQPSVTGEKHPTLAELKAAASQPGSHPQVGEHVAACAMCRSIVSASSDAFDSAPIVLDLPKGLVTEAAFRWPADPVAQGGMAQIFAGEDKRLGRTVILKAPREGEELQPGMAELFQRRVTAEAKILAKLQHPAIVTIYELGRSTVGWPFCVMERVDGESLRDKLDALAEQEKASGKPATRERLELLSGLVSIAEALAYAHERRVVHRDCTPNNILLGKRGEATLIDWGIARDLDAPGSNAEATLSADDPAASGRMVTISAGTPPYLPLEQSQGKRADPSFDVYSFGVTLYEVVSGNTPFEWDLDANRTQQLESFLAWLKTGDAVPPAMPKDPELSGIIARAMAHAPGDRFTADELVRALKQYLTGDLVFSHRYSASGRLARWMSRHKAATVAMVAVVLFAIGGALVWVQLSRARAERAELESTAAAAKVEASEKARAADQAARDAESARAQAEAAEKDGKNAKALRDDAERKRRAAEKLRAESEAAAKSAQGTADEAVKRYQEAMKAKEEADLARDAADAARAGAEKDRDAAKAAQSAAERDREAARAAQGAAERDRDAAKAAQGAAEKDRDAARTAQGAAEKDRDAARAAQGGAEKDRDAARAAQGVAEKDRDAARAKVQELEAKLRALESGGGGAGGGGAGGGGGGGPTTQPTP